METPYNAAGMRLSILISGLGLALTGCSSLRGARFDHESTAPGTVLKGVPFTLNRPVPTVTRSPAESGGPDRYAIKFDYLPDPNGRYTLQVDPALLSSVDFQMTFDANGSLTETTAKTTDHTGSLLTAIGKAAVSFSAADTAGGKSEEELAQELFDEGTRYLDGAGNRLFDSLASRDRNRVVARPITPMDREAWKAASLRLRPLAHTGQARKSFVYVNRAEYEILTTLLMLRRQDRTPEKLSPTFHLAAANVAKTPNDQSKVNEITLAYLRLDKRRIVMIRSEIVTARATLRALYAQVPNADNAKALEDNYKLLQVANAAKLTAEDSFLVDLADLEHTDWQRRMVAYLNAQIDARRHINQIDLVSRPRTRDPVRPATGLGSAVGAAASRDGGADPYLASLLDRKAAVLGVLPERTRRVQVTSSLAASKVPNDLKPLRDEQAALEATEAAVEAALKPKAGEAAKTDEPEQAELLVMATDDVPSSQVIKRRLGNDKRPRYVLVLQPVIGTPAKGGTSPSPKEQTTIEPKKQSTTNPAAEAPVAAPVPPIVPSVPEVKP